MTVADALLDGNRATNGFGEWLIIDASWRGGVHPCTTLEVSTYSSLFCSTHLTQLQEYWASKKAQIGLLYGMETTIDETTGVIAQAAKDKAEKKRTKSVGGRRKGKEIEGNNSPYRIIVYNGQSNSGNSTY